MSITALTTTPVNKSSVVASFENSIDNNYLASYYVLQSNILTPLCQTFLFFFSPVLWVLGQKRFLNCPTDNLTHLAGLQGIPRPAGRLSLPNMSWVLLPVAQDQSTSSGRCPGYMQNRCSRHLGEPLLMQRSSSCTASYSSVTELLTLRQSLRPATLGRNTFWQLVFVILFFWFLPTVHDYRLCSS